MTFIKQHFSSSTQHRHTDMDRSEIVVLDVGGVKFRSTKPTLTMVDSYFSRLLNDSWFESNSTIHDHEYQNDESVDCSRLNNSSIEATEADGEDTLRDRDRDIDRDRGRGRSASFHTAKDSKGGYDIPEPEIRVLFIDRDPTCFPTILSYLRSQKVFFTAGTYCMYNTYIHTYPHVYLHTYSPYTPYSLFLFPTHHTPAQLHTYTLVPLYSYFTSLHGLCSFLCL